MNKIRRNKSSRIIIRKKSCKTAEEVENTVARIRTGTRNKAG